jgi:hypothetical protein
VGEDALSIRGYPNDQQILMLAGREVGKSVNPAKEPLKAARAHVVAEYGRRNSGFLGLPAREKTLLFLDGLPEEIPSGLG